MQSVSPLILFRSPGIFYKPAEADVMDGVLSKDGVWGIAVKGSMNW